MNFLVSFDWLQNSNFRSNIPFSLGAMGNFDHISDCKAYKKECWIYIAKQRYFLNFLILEQTAGRAEVSGKIWISISRGVSGQKPCFSPFLAAFSFKPSHNLVQSKKVLHKVLIIGSMDVWECLDDFECFEWKEMEWGCQLKIMENTRYSTTTIRCPWDH